ncbi:MAG: cation:proton antiporter, partial [Beijerinckiaceae bacterium]|nr:cation:proton antiporter [Beijerinckiaceae bacterium]
MLAAVLSTFNARYVRLPQTIGLTIMGAILSALIIVTGRLFPSLGLIHMTRAFVDGLDFRATLLDGMLSFLLFAGAFQINLRDMRDGRWTILILSILGTVLSTVITGFGLKLLLTFSGPDVP